MSTITSLPFLLAVAALAALFAIGVSVAPDRRRDRPARDRGHVPQHAALPRRIPAHARAARPFADPQDASDPDGSVWARSLRQDPGWEPTPVPVLARVRAGLLALDEPPAAAEPEMSPAAVAVLEDAPMAEREPETEFSVTAYTTAMAEELERWLDENVRSVPVPDDGGPEVTP